MNNKSLFLIFVQICLAASQNNVCTDYVSYILKWPNCYHSPDLYQTVDQVSKRYTGLTETHTVQTQDGYLLTTFRIPKATPNKGVIVLKHASLFTDSSVWVNQQNQSLAFELWRKGYDVWLTNERGTKYCQKHVNLTIKNPKFWDFTINEIGVFEVGANIDYIKNVTGAKQVILLDYSAGFSSSLIYYTENPAKAVADVKLNIVMAPVAILKNLKSVPVRIVANSESLLKGISSISGPGSVLQYNSTLIKSIREFAIITPFKYPITLFKSFAMGWTPQELDPVFLNLLYSVMPSGTSWKNGFHFCQLVTSGQFQKYDYGAKKNKQLYKSEKPPVYDLTKVKIPIFPIYSEDDYISTVTDVEALVEILPQETKKFGKRKISGINHLDFNYGKHRFSRIYNHIFDVLGQV